MEAYKGYGGERHLKNNTKNFSKFDENYKPQIQKAQ